MLGKPVFKGTRLTVDLVLKALGAGTTQDELRSYTFLRMSTYTCCEAGSINCSGAF